MTAADRTAGEAALPSAIAAEVERQQRAIMRGASFGDEETRRTMEGELRQRLAHSLQTGRPLRVYLGVDPTAPDLHLGHCVSLRKLRTLQDLGHHSILLIGDFTGLVGDPSDKEALRPMAGAEALEANARTYRAQALKVLDPERTELRRNSEWLSRLTFRDLIDLASRFTVAQFIERDTFRRRLERGAPVYLHEFLYGLMQAYDAYALETDVQIGGTDQTFNLLAGRILQRAHGQRPQVALTMPILVGLDGRARMSKSAGNHIGINEPPDEQYGKAMSIPDSALPDYLSLATNLPAEEVEAMEAGREDDSLHPLEAKKRLAHAIVAEWHGEAAAEAAAERFARTFSQGKTPAAMPEVALSFDGDTCTVDLAALLTEAGAVRSKAEVKRLLTQGGIQLNGERVTAAEIALRPGGVFKIGKRRWLQVVAR